MRCATLVSGPTVKEVAASKFRKSELAIVNSSSLNVLPSPVF